MDPGGSRKIPAGTLVSGEVYGARNRPLCPLRGWCRDTWRAAANLTSGSVRPDLTPAIGRLTGFMHRD
jgi:hypothetical protein